LPAVDPQRRRWLLILALLAFLVPFLVPVPRSLEAHPVWGGLGTIVHIALPLAATLLLTRIGPVAGRIWLAGLAVLLLGGGIELAQQVVGRTPRWTDLGQDALGIGLAVAWHLWSQRRRPIALVALIVLTAAALDPVVHIFVAAHATWRARQRFPVIADFETGDQRRLWSIDDGDETIVPDPVTGGQVLRFADGPTDGYVGVTGRGFPGNWSGYRTLEGKIRGWIGDRRPVRVALRVDDLDSDVDAVWATWRLRATPQWRPFAVDLDSLSRLPEPRPLDLEHVHALVFFVGFPPDSVRVEIDDLVLRR